ncbi:MAG: hypothetical protein JWN73_768 [Betaproteobacteria bacterium]|nr:hypothetical protein [Betaproteobacteria bacterium]
MSEALPDDGIPVLTDIVDSKIQLPPLTRPGAPYGPAQNSGPMSGFGPGPIPGAVPLTRAGPPSLSEFSGFGAEPHESFAPHPNSAEAFAERVRTAVLDRLLPRIEPVVEARLKENLSELLEKVLAEMTAELKLSTRDIIRETVAQAVSEEIAARRENDQRPP